MFKLFKFLTPLLAVADAVESVTAKPGTPGASPVPLIILRPSYKGIKLRISVARVI